MKATLALVALAQAIASVNASVYYGGCNGDECANVITANYNGAADCSRYGQITVKSGTSTKKSTSTKKTTSTVKSTETTTDTSTLTSTTTTTVIVSNTQVGTATITTTLTNVFSTIVFVTTTTTVGVTTTGTTTVSDGTLTTTLPISLILGPTGAARRSIEEEHKDLEKRATTYTSGNPPPSNLRLPNEQANCNQWGFVRGASFGYNEDYRSYDFIDRYYSTSDINRYNLGLWNPALKSDFSGWQAAQGHYLCINIKRYPTYASSCGVVKFRSVCSNCLNIPTSTKRVFAATTTSKCTVTSWATTTSVTTVGTTVSETTITTETTTSTTVLSATSTVTVTITTVLTNAATSTTTVTATTTDGVTSTVTVPAATSSVCPVGANYVISGSSCVDTNTDKNNCGRVGNACSNSCIAGACAAFTGAPSTCVANGGQLCGGGSTCVAVSNTEGQHLCAIIATCDGAATCTKSTDCISGFTCVNSTCCGDSPVCMRVPTGCPNGSAASAAEAVLRRKSSPAKRNVYIEAFDPDWKLKRKHKV
ncbi:hypothetical protein TWF694_001760 [Orbilia ellipsospora]|uniref:SCP domain-containing protein n=1 Tax=Orbilia ellipsospora TaxID=2528407 RepID=A0AAV9X4Q9_9PEZI